MAPDQGGQYVGRDPYPVSPEAAMGGPIALVRNGDQIEADIPGRRLNLLVPAEELEARRGAWTPPPP